MTFREAVQGTERQGHMETPVTEAFREILTGVLTGTLVVETDKTRRELHFSNGNLIFARTSVIQERLGEVLYKMGSIDEPTFARLRQEIGSTQEKTGKLLFSWGAITQKTLYAALIQQVRTIATQSFLLNQGRWHFENREPDIPKDSHFFVALEDIISAGCDLVEHIAYYRDGYARYRIRTRPGLVPAEHLMDNIGLWSLITREPDLIPQKILGKLKSSELLVWRNLLRYYLLGLLDFLEAPEERDAPRIAEEVLALSRRIQEESPSPYTLLGVSAKDTDEAIRKAYFGLARRFHPDRLSNLPDPGIRDKATQVLAAVNLAFEQVETQEKRQSLASRQASAQDAKSSVNLQEKAKILYRKAKTLYAQQKYWEASTLMEEAVRLDDSRSAYYLLLGLSQSNNPNSVRAAEFSLTRSAELDPFNAEPLVALGLLFLSQSMPRRAEGFFRQALSVNPDHSVARRRMDELIPPKKSQIPFAGLFGKK